MISKRPARRAAVVTAVTLVPLAVFGGVGLAKGNPSASEYQYGPSGQQYKVNVCHATGSKKHPWHQISVSVNAWNHGHSKHSHKGNKDFLVGPNAPCPPVASAPAATPTAHGNSGDHGNNGNNGNHGNGNNGDNGKGHGKH